MRRPSTDSGGPAAMEGRLKGTDVCSYMEEFHDKYLVLGGKSIVRFNTEVLNIRRGEGGVGWDVDVRELPPSPTTGGSENMDVKATLHFPRIVVCTGGTSAMKVPPGLEPASALRAGFKGPVMHSGESWSMMDAVQTSARSSQRPIIVVGGGKSAQE